MRNKFFKSEDERNLWIRLNAERILYSNNILNKYNNNDLGNIDKPGSPMYISNNQLTYDEVNCETPRFSFEELLTLSQNELFELSNKKNNEIVCNIFKTNKISLDEIISQFFNELHVFFNTTNRNKWIVLDGFRMYVRKSKRLYNNKLINCFDIASMEADIPGSGILTTIMIELLKIYPTINIFVESILNQKLFLFFEKYGFIKYKIGNEEQNSMILIQEKL